MKIFDLIRMGFKNLWRRKLRTFLTILGVLIGCTSIVVMLSLGIALKVATEQQIKQMGGLNKIEVHPDYESMNNRTRSRTKEYVEPHITDKQIEQMKKIPGVKAVSPFYEVYVKLISGENVANLRIIGLDPSAMKIFQFEVGQGRLLKKDDTLGVVYGNRINRRFHNPKERRRRGPRKPVEIDLKNDRIRMTFDQSYGEHYPGQTTKKRPKLYTLECVGLLKPGDWEKDSNVYMNIEYLKKLKKDYDKKNNKNEQGNNKSRRNKDEGYAEAKVYVEDIKEIPKVMEKLKALGLQAYSMTKYLEQEKKRSAVVQAILGGIGAISLLVAAIGITNTMVMSIYERTKEIGVMKVIGAKLRDIKRIFLFEAGMIGFFGGVVGIILSYGVSILLNKVGANFMKGAMGPSPDGQVTKISVIPIWLAGLSLVFSTFIGLISGFYPAKRAMRLSALEAIRTE